MFGIIFISSEYWRFNYIQEQQIPTVSCHKDSHHFLKISYKYKKTILYKNLAIASDIAAASSTFNVLTLFGLRNEPIISKMPRGCATYYPESQILCCAYNLAAVGPTFNIFSYYVSPPKCRATKCYTKVEGFMLLVWHSSSRSNFSYEAVLAENRSHHLPWRANATCYATVEGSNSYTKNLNLLSL